MLQKQNLEENKKNFYEKFKEDFNANYPSYEKLFKKSNYNGDTKMWKESFYSYCFLFL